MDGKLTQKECSNFVGFSQKRKEHVTPYKIAVVCLINQMCILRYKIRPNAYLCKGERGITIKPQHLRDFYLLTLKLIHCPDLAFTELHKLLTGNTYELMPELLTNYEKLCDKILVKKIDGLMDTINNLNKMLIDLPGQVSPLVNKSSPVGLFLRRMMLHFDKLSFPQTILVFESFERYIRDGREEVVKEKEFVLKKPMERVGIDTSTPESVNTASESKSQMDLTADKLEDVEMDISEVEKPSEEEGVFKPPTAVNTPFQSKLNFTKSLPLLSPSLFPPALRGDVTGAGGKPERWEPGAIWSRKQAELFISQQAMYLLNNPQQALPPPLLQERLKQILKHNPEHAEAYYLSYLNCLRVNEFCGALENLYHYFDRSNTLLNHEDKPKGLRFAALNLGILYAHFGHKEEALRALREAIALSHEVSDNQCLQHIQAWYYKLTGNEKMVEKQMERSILKSSDLNLHFLTSFGLLSFSRFASSMGTKPSLVFELTGNEKMVEKQMERSILKSSDLNLHFLTSFGLLSFSRFASSMGTKPSLVFEVGHEVSDNQCLQHIQAWYYKLTGNEKMVEKQMERSILKSSDLNLHFLTSFGLLSFSRFASSMGTKPSLVFELTGNEKMVEKQMERSILKSSDLNLHFLTSFGLLSFSRFASSMGTKPSLVFELLHKSDLLNFHYDITDLMANSYATKAGLWSMYGKTEMASLMSQMLLHLDLKDPTIGLTCYNGESVCLAICNVTSRFIEEGEFHLATIILSHARERFPQERSWQLVEQLLAFTQALYQRRWLDAQRAVDQIAAHDKIESKLRRAELLIERENFREAMETINSLFESVSEKMGALHQTRALILAGKATMCESNRCDRMPLLRQYASEVPVDRCASTGSAAVNHFMKAVTTGSEFYLNYYACMATIEHAKLLYDKGFTNQALRLMEDGIVTVLAHGTAYDQASALYFYLVCEANSIQETNGPMREEALMEIVKTLDRVKDTFKRLGVIHKIQSVVFLQAMLCEDIGRSTELYKYSLEFRKLDEMSSSC